MTTTAWIVVAFALGVIAEKIGNRLRPRFSRAGRRSAEWVIAKLRKQDGKA